jgi:hypothetical protein
MAHSISNSNTFLAYFNHIDKFFEIVLGLSSYMPFIEKVDKVSQGRYPVSSFVRKYQHKLKYFGDLRNQVVHGFRLEQHHYLLASDYAVEQIKTIHEHLTKPPTIQNSCLRDIPSITVASSLQEAISLLTEADLPALPVKNAEGIYVDTLFLKQIVTAALQPSFLEQSVASCLTSSSSQALFMPADASIYEIEGLFSMTRADDKHNELVRVTTTGHPDEPILWIITAADLPKLDQDVIL